LTSIDADELGQTSPVEIPPPAAASLAGPPVAAPTLGPPAADPARQAIDGLAAPQPAVETVYVPLAITVGDGFKFGCGFFLALVLAMLVGFVLVSALFVLTSLFGVSLPLTR
jgi:hypothetical protein